MAGLLSTFGGLLAAPAFNTALGLAGTAIGGVQQGIGQLGARIANQRRYRQGMGLLNTQNQVTQNTVGPLAQSLMGQYGAQPGEQYNAYTNLYNPILDAQRAQGQQLNAQYGDLAGNVNAGFQNRLNTSMGMLEGAGAQERTDINRQFADYGAANANSLTGRGLIGSTLASAVGAQNQRAQSDALGGLNERLLQQRLGTYAGLSGDALQAQQQLGQGQIGLQQGLNQQELAMRQGFGQNALGAYFGAQGQNLAAQQQFGMMPLDYYRQNVGQTLNWISGRNDTAPDPSAYYNAISQMGRGSVQGPQAQSADWFGPTAGALGTAGGLGAMGAFLGGSGAGFASMAPLAMLGVSDRRLKFDITPLGGKTAGGVPLYYFKYIWQPNMWQVGVMADEAAEKFPEAVKKGPNDFLIVDYSKIN